MAKTVIVRARFSESDLALLDALAEAEGLDRSKLLRRAFRAYGAKPYFTDADAALVQDAIAELNAIGRNLMMALRQMNRLLKGGVPDADARDHFSRDEFEKLQATVASLVKTLRCAVHQRHTQERKP